MVWVGGRVGMGVCPVPVKVSPVGGGVSGWRDSHSYEVWQLVSGYPCRSAMITLHSNSTDLIYSNPHGNLTKPPRSSMHIKTKGPLSQNININRPQGILPFANFTDRFVIFRKVLIGVESLENVIWVRSVLPLQRHPVVKHQECRNPRQGVCHPKPSCKERAAVYLLLEGMLSQDVRSVALISCYDHMLENSSLGNIGRTLCAFARTMWFMTSQM